jgi:G:T/U-mismatch repair DNA glycosylase
MELNQSLSQQNYAREIQTQAYTIRRLEQQLEEMEIWFTVLKMVSPSAREELSSMYTQLTSRQ